MYALESAQEPESAEMPEAGQQSTSENSNSIVDSTSQEIQPDAGTTSGNEIEPGTESPLDEFTNSQELSSGICCAPCKETVPSTEPTSTEDSTENATQLDVAQSMADQPWCVQYFTDTSCVEYLDNCVDIISSCNDTLNQPDFCPMKCREMVNDCENKQKQKKVTTNEYFRLHSDDIESDNELRKTAGLFDEYTAKINFDCPGNNIGGTFKYDELECAKECTTNPKCSGFSHNHGHNNTNTCILKSEQCLPEDKIEGVFSFYHEPSEEKLQEIEEQLTEISVTVCETNDRECYDRIENEVKDCFESQNTEACRNIFSNDMITANPSCFTKNFTPEHCCASGVGKDGMNCWMGTFDYDSCCGVDWEKMQYGKDVLMKNKLGHM